MPADRHRQTRAQSLPLQPALLIAILLAVLLCTACALHKATLSVAGPVEYTLDPIDASQVIACDNDDVKMQFHDDIVASRVGVQTVSVELSQGPLKRTEEVEVTVADTKAPVIELAEERVSVEMGTGYDPHENVPSVEDPVDGTLPEVAAEPTAQGSEVGLEQVYDEGWYLLSGDFDPDTAGIYELEAVACDQHGNRTEQGFTVEVVDPLAGVELEQTTDSLEYAHGKVKPIALVSCSIDDVDISADPLALDEVGAHTVTYTLSKGASTREIEKTFVVTDTKAPTIELAKEKVTVTMGADFKPQDNVKKVADPVEGELSLVKKRPKANAKGRSTKAGMRRFYDGGWYTVSGDYDLMTAGTYTVTVLACDQHANETQATYILRVKDPLKGVKLNKKTTVLEYANEDIDPVKLVTCSIGEATVSASPLSLRELGAHKVEYTVALGASSRTYVRTFKTRDTKSPYIELGANEWTIEAGEGFDPYQAIVSVSDPVDGDLPRYDSEPGENGDGWYTITGTYNASTAGRYFFNVIACDRNGNRTTKEFSLLVTQKVAPVDNARDYVLNTQSGVFHYPSCGFLPTVNRRDVHMTREDVVAQGYRPCGHCRP